MKKFDSLIITILDTLAEIENLEEVEEVEEVGDSLPEVGISKAEFINELHIGLIALLMSNIAEPESTQV